ncbi:MAG: dihydroorotate dehydrogenase electron transfer subunit [Candidatus Brocadiia bacterium]
MPDSQKSALSPQLPTVLPLLEKRVETPRMVTLFFPVPEPKDAAFCPADSQPGQFVMLWIPRIDEKPYVISSLSDDRFGITVLKRGPFSTQLHEMETGTEIGFRGPYGRGFWGWDNAVDPARIALIGGGCGMAPLALLADQLSDARVIQGAPSNDELLFKERFHNHTCFTEDGSAGQTGLPTAWLEQALQNEELDRVYACGPEVMMQAVVAMCRAKDIPCQVALERYMKCGFGVCGQCECDGKLVCQDGPVFSADELEEMPSFGRHRRDGTGQKIQTAGRDSCATGEPG